MTKRYRITADISGKGGEREIEGRISSTTCYTPEVAEAILPSRDASMVTQKIREPEVIATAAEMEDWEMDLEDMSGPTDLELNEIEAIKPLTVS